MKVVIPVNEDETTICPSFGRAPYFLFWESESNQFERKENPAAQASGAAGIQAAQFLTDEQCQILLTPRCGENAAQILQAAGITMFLTSSDSVKTELDAWKEGKLSVLTDFPKGFSHSDFQS